MNTSGNSSLVIRNSDAAGATGRGGVDLRVHVARSEEELAQLEEPWTALLLKSSYATVFASYQWNIAWWRHFGAGNALRVITVWDEGRQLVGIAPLMARRFGPAHKLEFLGTGLSDKGDLLLHPDFGSKAATAIFAYLRAKHRSWDLVDLSEVPTQSSLLDYLSDSTAGGGLQVSVTTQTPLPAVDLPATWEEFVNSLARKRRYYVGSYPRKFLREYDGSVEVVVGGPDLPAAVREFHRLHMASWEGREKELSWEHRQPDFLPFLQEASKSLAEQGWLRILLLKAGDQYVAATLNFILHSRWSGYMKGFDPTWSERRAGTVLDALRIRQAISEEAKQFDLGRGAEPYKSGFGIEMGHNKRVLIASAAPRSMAAFALLKWHIRRSTADGRSPAP